MHALDAVLTKLPAPLRTRLYRHAELAKFAVVGGSAFVIDTAIFLGLKSGVLETKPVTAKVISTLIATIFSYVLSREWSFRTRGGRAGHHEAMLFFVVSGLGIAVTTAPLWISRYGLDLATPNVSHFTQEVADFVSAQIVGTLLAMVFRWWAFRRFVFPNADARPRGAKNESALAGSPVATTGSAAAGTLVVEPGAAGPAVAGPGLARHAAAGAAAEAARPALDPIDMAAAELLGDPWPLIDEFVEPDDAIEPVETGGGIDSDNDGPYSRRR